MRFEPVVHGPRWPVLTTGQRTAWCATLEGIAERRRTATHCQNGHEFDETRRCKICAKEKREDARQARLRRLIAFPDDPRHGTYWASRDGCKCSKCFRARVAHCEKERQRYNERIHI